MNELPPRVFVDTDVILDFCQRREPHYAPAARLFLLAHQGFAQLVTSAAGLKEVFTIARKLTDERRARDIIRDLMQVLTVCPVDAAMWVAALSSHQKDTEDALQVACARREAALYLVTRNIRDYKKIIDPMVFVPEAMVLALTHGDRERSGLGPEPGEGTGGQ